MKQLLLFVFTLFVFASSGSAQNCTSPKNNADVKECAQKELETATKEINSVYNAYRGTLDESSKLKIREVQLAWIKFRDLSCQYEADGLGSTGGFIFSNCLTRFTKQRTKDLREMATCVEGDITCKRNFSK